MVFYWLVYRDSVQISSRQVSALTVGNKRVESNVADVASLVRKPAMPVKEVHFKGWFLTPVKMDTKTGLRCHVPNQDETLAETLSRMSAGETLGDAMRKQGSPKVVKRKKKKKSRRRRSGSFGSGASVTSQDISFGEDSGSDTELFDGYSDSVRSTGSSPILKTHASLEDRSSLKSSSSSPRSFHVSSVFSVIRAHPIDLQKVPTKCAMKKKTLQESLESQYACTTRYHVHFDTVQIREHIVCLGDNPACSWGPPISLSWEYKTEPQIHDCDDYTIMRNDLKFERDEDYDFVLSRNDRERILDALGVSIRAQTEADLETRRIQKEREDTIHKLKFMKMEERLETLKNAKNAAKRLITLKGGKEQHSTA